jgi:hypothetical protein
MREKWREVGAREGAGSGIRNISRCVGNPEITKKKMQVRLSRPAIMYLTRRLEQGVLKLFKKVASNADYVCLEEEIG